MKYQSVKGMDDLFGSELEKWQALEAQSRRFFEAHGFTEIRTPILEQTGLFERSIGEASDIVYKEMYTFEDRGGRSLTLRPEMTAGVVRAAVEHHLLKEGEPLFVYYIGQMFRSERPQAGRKRQFHQIGVETLNTHSAINDAELIIMVKNYLDALGLSSYTIKINHLGSQEDQLRFARDLSKYFSKNKSKLCKDCQFRLSKNVLRILDCKVKSCQPVIEKAPKQKLSGAANKNFDEVQAIVKEAGVPVEVSARLVRGLDYYSGCVYEVTAKGLGAQDAILAGGRYDGLIHDLGGPKMGASGFSIGVERLMTALEAQSVAIEKLRQADTVYVAGLVHGSESCAFMIEAPPPTLRVLSALVCPWPCS